MIDEKSLHYTTSHEWVHVEGEMATVGISRFAVEQLTDLILIDLPKVGRRVEAGKSLGEIESVKAVSDIYSPVTGEVIEVNQAVADDVQLLASDPYHKGWLVKVKLDAQAKGSPLLSFSEYQSKVADSAH